MWACNALTPEELMKLAGTRNAEWVSREHGSKRNHIWRCKAHRHEWTSTIPWFRKSKYDCPKCAGTGQKVTQDYIDIARKRGFVWTEADVSGGVRVKHQWMCQRGHSFLSSFTDIKSGYGCATCARNQRKTPEMYRKLGEETGYTWVGVEVKSVFDKTEWLCPKSHRFLAPYHMLDIGRGCPICKESRYERLITDVLTAWGIPHEREKRFRECRRKGTLPFDFYIPSLNVLIEFQGPHHTKAQEQWGGQEALSSQQEKDQIKRKFAKANGMHLIEIDYTTENIPGYLARRISRATGIPRSTIMGDSKLKSTRSKIKGAIQFSLIENMIEYTSI